MTKRDYDTVSQGGGNSFHIPICLPSPLAGEGRVRGHIPNFSQLPFAKRGLGGFESYFLTKSLKKRSPS
jgi:hypothetical protein